MSFLAFFFFFEQLSAFLRIYYS